MGHNFLSFFLGQYLEKMYLCTRIRTTDSPNRIGFRNNLDFVIVFNVSQDDGVSSWFFLCLFLVELVDAFQ